VSDHSEQSEKEPSSLCNSLEMRVSEEMVTFFVSIMAALLQRRIENTEEQLEKLKKLKQEELVALWIQLNKSAPVEDALHIFINWLEGQLDGNGLSC